MLTKDMKKTKKGKQKKQYEELMDLTPTKKVALSKKRSLEQKDMSTKTSNLSGEPPKKKPKKNNKFKFPENVKPKLRPEPQVAPPRTQVAQHKADPAEEKMPKEIEEEVVDTVSTEDDTEESKPKVVWVNKQRVLTLSSRGILPQHRHLMLNLRSLLPHSKPEPKRDPRTPLYTINELCEQKSCNKCLYFTSKNKSLYLWVANVPEGPSAKFLVESSNTMEEIKLPGNCLQGSHALLAFDKSFEKLPQYSLVRELFTQIFATPRGHPRSKHCVDHVLSFALIDNRIWFRNFQILEEGQRCEEIGPRMVLNLVKIYSGSFEGACLYSNPHYHKLKQLRKLMSTEEVDSSESDNEL